ncbi:MAG: ribonuclease T [Rhodobacteraceae bacterium]|nr:MAG: ribonuclease T [Paracoccaceae bacterium]
MRKLGVSVMILTLGFGLWWLQPDPEASGTSTERPSSSHATPRDGYLLLAISWTPSWCALEGDARGAARCATGAGTGWLVHGLWPQHDEGGWPEFCTTPHPAPSRAETAAMIDIMGSDGLALHQWRKHGSCTELSPGAYFDQTRVAFEAFTLPDPMPSGSGPAQLAPNMLLASFRAANPQIEPDMAILTCRDGMAQEIRVCLTHDLTPRPCDAALLSRSCRARNVRLPPRP